MCGSTCAAAIVAATAVAAVAAAAVDVAADAAADAIDGGFRCVRACHQLRLILTAACHRSVDSSLLHYL